MHHVSCGAQHGAQFSARMKNLEVVRLEAFAFKQGDGEGVAEGYH